MIAPRFEMNTVRSGYIELCHALRDEGAVVTPRGLPCREFTGVTLVVHDPVADAMPGGLNRRLNPAIGVAEALQLIAGEAWPALMCRIAPNFERFLDGEAFYGSYGPRIAGVLDHVYDQLVADPDTRQAVATIWRPDDAWATTRDLPCTTSLQFLLRNGALELHTTMRSNDVWWGWAYDAFQFTRLQQAMADALDVAVGPYVHRAGSFHLYTRDLDAVDELEYDPDWRGFTHLLLKPDDGPGDGFRSHRKAASRLLHGDVDDFDVNGRYLQSLAVGLSVAETR